jgi:type II secretory pathway component PulF
MHTSYIRHLAWQISYRDDAVLAELLLDLEAGHSLRDVLERYARPNDWNDVLHPTHRDHKKLAQIFIELEAGRPLREILDEYRHLNPFYVALRIKAEARDTLEEALQ